VQIVVLSNGYFCLFLFNLALPFIDQSPFPFINLTWRGEISSNQIFYIKFPKKNVSSSRPRCFRSNTRSRNTVYSCASNLKRFNDESCSNGHPIIVAERMRKPLCAQNSPVPGNVEKREGERKKDIWLVCIKERSYPIIKSVLWYISLREQQQQQRLRKVISGKSQSPKKKSWNIWKQKSKEKNSQDGSHRGHRKRWHPRNRTEAGFRHHFGFRSSGQPDPSMLSQSSGGIGPVHLRRPNVAIIVDKQRFTNGELI